MTPAEADKAQQWAGMDGRTAWHLIERHADDWGEAGEMMNAWLRANVARALDEAADEEPINGNELAQLRLSMKCERVRCNARLSGAGTASA